MKKIIALFCIGISFIICGIMTCTNSALSEEKKVMTMTELYESGAESARDTIITIESKEEMMLFNKYLNEGKDTRKATFRLIKDIYWSDYRFRYDKESDRIGVYKGDNLEVVYKWEMCKEGEIPKAKEYKDYQTEEENTGNQYKIEENYWISDDVIMQGDFDGNHHTIYGFLSKTALFNEMYGYIKDLTFSSVYIEGMETRLGLLSNILIGTVQNCNITDGYGFSAMISSVKNKAVIENCEVSAYLVNKQGLEFFGMVVMTGTVDMKNITVHGKIQSVYETDNMDISIGGIIGHPDSVNMDSCRSDVEIKGNITYAGGIVGYNRSWCAGDETIKNCIYEGNMDITNNIYAGGIFGFTNGTLIYEDILQCINRGNIKSDGICGGICGGIYSNVKIVNCTNQGTISAVGETKFYDYSQIIPYAGGIIGIGRDYCVIYNCVNQGDVFSAEGYAGGICNDEIALDSKGPFSVLNCYSAGEVTSMNGQAGEIIGRLSNTSLQYCYYLKKENKKPVGLQENETVKVIYGVTDDQLMGRETKKKIAFNGYARAFTVRDALNNWVRASKEEVYYWVDGEKGPMWKEGIQPPEPVPEPSSTPTPEPSPTLDPTFTPNSGITSSSSTSSKRKEKKKTKTKKMRAPTFTLKKKKTTSGRRYVRIRLKKYAGKYIEIKVKKKKKFYKLKLKNNNIKKNKKIFNFSYSSQKGTLTFKIRTYVKKGKKKVYSKESKKKRIRLS